MALDAADEAELIRLREMIKWQTRVIGQLQQELRAERAIGDFWAAESARNRSNMGIDFTDIYDWHAARRQP